MLLKISAMRIKRLLSIGTFNLLFVCLGLYLLLDNTVNQSSRKIQGQEESQVLMNRRDVTLPKINTSVSLTFSTKFQQSFDHQPIRCSSPEEVPPVDIQMGDVYESMKFDNDNGGVWKQGWPITYSDRAFTPDRKLRVFVVPHSHNDPGWLQTFEGYYESKTRSILNNMVVKLMEDERRKFIWAEMSFFALWWSESSHSTKEKVKLLLKRGQLEIVTGGWVMADEANSHFYSVLEQLTQGQQWLLEHLNYKPSYSWSIDPFGLSPSFPLILKNSGFKGLAVQRSHYSVKKYLAKKKQLEFRWRQLWDGSGYTDILTHMMPFYSYDIPHTCGPDPKVCCQFDFKRLRSISGIGFTCPWKINPQLITDKNVQSRADLLIDQYKKKARLYSTEVLLVPLGDDFRYDHSTEWDAQFQNYQRLFDFINNHSSYSVYATFGTLRDYFSTVEERKPTKYFPSLSGDFFTYADRDDHYWSGYYTSRPFYKRMDRILMSALRSAEVLLALAVRRDEKVVAWVNLLANLSEARASHSLFQHHDGITGTAKDFVVIDYFNKMMEALKASHHIIQQAARFLLIEHVDWNQTGDEVYFVVESDDRLMSQSFNSLLTLPSGIEERHVVLVNTLTFARREAVNFGVENHLVQVTDRHGNLVPHQISPICSIEGPSSLCYQLSFDVEIGPLSLVTYIVRRSKSTLSLANVRLFDQSWQHKYGDWPHKIVEARSDAFSLENDHMVASFSRAGLLVGVTIKTPIQHVAVPVNITFVRYSTRRGGDRSGAYLFLPDGPAQPIVVDDPVVTIVEGKLKAEVFVYFEHVVHVTTIHMIKGRQGKSIEIRNLVDISQVGTNFELAMRVSSSIENDNVFYTDLNSLQMIRRKRLSTIPLQANYYPMPSAVYIQDDSMRMTILSGQPLGVASLSSGQIEIMQDRRLRQDDNRGLEQGVMDNRPILATFKLLLEPRKSLCPTLDSPWGALTDLAHSTQEALMSPLSRLLWTGDHRAGPPPTAAFGSPLPVHQSLVVARVLRNAATGFVLRSVALDQCFSSSRPEREDTVNLTAAFGLKNTAKVHEATLTFNQIGLPVPRTTSISMCANSLSAFYVSN